MKKTVSVYLLREQFYWLMVYSLIILGESYIRINITYSSGKWSDQVNFLNSIYNFRCKKYVKKGTWK